MVKINVSASKDANALQKWNNWIIGIKIDFRNTIKIIQETSYTLSNVDIYRE